MFVSEIFMSIQGESSYVGIPCVFVRLSGCNLACEWCDTEYARSVEEGKEMSLDEILKEVSGFNSWLVEITGGEPLLQEGVGELAEELLKADYKVLLETNGTESFEGLPDDLVKIVDIKCPSSKHEGSFKMDNLGHINPEDEIKFVIGNREDYEFAKRFVEEFICDRTDKILFAPVRPEMEPSVLAEWILKDTLRVRLQLQMHKYIWDEERR